MSTLGVVRQFQAHAIYVTTAEVNLPRIVNGQAILYFPGRSENTHRRRSVSGDY